jgi:hypothetical protein
MLMFVVGTRLPLRDPVDYPTPATASRVADRTERAASKPAALAGALVDEVRVSSAGLATPARLRTK